MLFLSEAFTRPARLYGLAKLGFTQSYSYFTWRTAKWELEEFGRQIAEHADYARPNLFVNTPDILHESLQHGGPGMFAIRAVLAATMGTSWGVYSGYELFEHRAGAPGQRGVPGLREVRIASPRLRRRRWPRAARWSRSSPGSTRFAGVHPALCQLRTIRFHHIDNDALLAYSKFDPVTGDTRAGGRDPQSVRRRAGHPVAGHGRAWVCTPYDRFWVRDEITGEEYQWGQANFVRLEPARAVAHILNMPPIPAEQRATLLRRE